MFAMLRLVVSSLALVAACLGMTYGVASLALQRPSLVRYDVALASQLEADYSADAPGAPMRPPLDPAIVDAARDDERALLIPAPTAAAATATEPDTSAPPASPIERPSGAPTVAPEGAATPVPPTPLPQASATPRPESTATPAPKPTEPLPSPTRPPEPTATPAPAPTRTPILCTGVIDDLNPACPRPTSTPVPSATPTSILCLGLIDGLNPACPATPTPTPKPSNKPAHAATQNAKIDGP